MEYDKDKILKDDSQCSGREQDDMLAYLLNNAETKPPVKGESVVLSRDLLKYFNSLLFVSHEVFLDSLFGDFTYWISTHVPSSVTHWKNNYLNFITIMRSRGP